MNGYLDKRRHQAREASASIVIFACTSREFMRRLRGQSFCFHPLAPVDVVLGVRVVQCAVMRSTFCGLCGDLHSAREQVPFEEMRPS